MPFHDAFEAELQLNTLVHRGRWEQALAAIDAWIGRDPGRTELLLRKAQIYRLLEKYEQGLAAVRQYRALKPDADEVVFLEVDFLLAIGLWADATRVLDSLPNTQRESAQACYYRGKALLAQRKIAPGLQQLWLAYQREPGFNRALLEWAVTAVRHYGKWWTRRQLEELLAKERRNGTLAVSVGLAINMVDSRYGQSLLRRAVDSHADFDPAFARRKTRKPGAPVDGQKNAQEVDAYRIVSEQLLGGHYKRGIDAYYQAVNADPSWLPVLAPLVAEVLVDELVRPEEARVLLEDAMRREPTDYRLHLSYTKVFLQLGFGEEARSSANCALALAPEEEKALALVQRACAYLLLKERDLALRDVQSALGRMPEIRHLVTQEPNLRILLRDRRLRGLLIGPESPLNFWERAKRWVLGD